MDLNEQIDRFIDGVKDLRVAIVGETIIDQFVPCKYEGQSMKSFCPVFRLVKGETQVQQGGASAVAHHLQEFVASVDLITNTNNEIVKTRYVDEDDGTKHLEINHFHTDEFKPIHVNCNDYDVVIVADFGHGYCNELTLEGAFHLMCQTNSNNFGFNRVSKWKNYRKKSICLDLREGTLQMNKKIKFKEPEEVLELYNYEMNTDQLFLTLGGKGAVYTDGTEVEHHGVFPSRIVDTIGAGDTFFGFSAVSAHLGLPADQMLAVPSLAASLSTTWLCNEQSVNPESLKTYATQFV